MDLIEKHMAALMFEEEDSQLDEAAVQCVDMKLLRLENDLMDRKWYDYRQLHPARATALFMECYKESHVRIMHRRVDIGRAPFSSGIKRIPLFAQATSILSGLWKARQMADRMCMRYDFYTLTILSIAEARNWRFLPRANQLYNKDLVSLLMEKWGEEIRSNIQVADDPRFLAENYEGHPDQLKYVGFLLLQAGLKANRDLALNSLINRHKALPERFARKRFGDQIVDKAMRLSY